MPGRQCIPVVDGHRRRRSGLTYTEVLISVVIIAMVFGLTIKAYVVTATREQWTGFSLAAESMGLQAIEEARSAVWDPAMQKNELTNMVNGINVISSSTSGSTTYITTTNILDLPWKGTNYMLATNFITITPLYENNFTPPSVQLQFLRVDTVWGFSGWGKTSLLYTNTICTYLAPDNRDPSSLGY